jgi:SAM-dependent methyltransferase
MDSRTLTRQLAHEHLAKNDPTGWFEELYSASAGDAEKIPWANLAPNPNLVQWLDAHKINGANRRALVVGCGLGDDAEELSRRGFAVTAFDIAPTAIAWSRRRFSNSAVNYVIADALNPPSDWRNHFDFIFESYTLQALPPAPRELAAKSIANLLAAAGSLLIISRAREITDAVDGPPWPLTLEDLTRFEQEGLTRESLEDYFDWEKEPIRRFRVLFRRGSK